MGIQHTIKANIRDVVASTLSLSGLTKFSHFPSSSITILTFHRVLPAKLRAEYPLPGLVVTPEELHWVLSQVKNDFDIQTLSNAYKASLLANRRKPLLAITFDDGQWDNYEYALPVLEAQNIAATFYVPTAYIGKTKLLWHDEAGFTWQQLGKSREKIFADISPVPLPDEVFSSVEGFLRYLKKLNANERNEFISRFKQFDLEFPVWSRLMDWNEINQLHEQGHEIGSHSRTHSLLSQLSLDAQRQELCQSMLDIKNVIGVQPSSFCYPDGNYDDRTLMLLKDCQYETSVTTKWGINRVISDRLQLVRCDISSKHLCDNKGALSKSRFQFRLSRFHPEI